MVYRIVIFGALAIFLASCSENDRPEKGSLSRGTEAPHKRAATLRWVDSESGEVLFALADIVRFDWEEQLFELRRERAIELMMLPGALQRDFVIKDDQGEIYHGCFMSRVSSRSHDGPTIPIAPVLRIDVKPPLYKIEPGYGEYREGGSRDKERFHPRLRAALEAAGLLENIDPATPPSPIATSFLGWFGGQHGLKIALILFPETNCIGKETRFQLRVARDKRFNLSLDRLELSVRWLAEGKSFPTTERMEIPLNTLEKGAYAYRGWPWGFEHGSVDPTVQAGRGEVTVQLQALRRSGNRWRIIGTWQIQAQDVEILQGLKGNATPHSGNNREQR